MTMPRGVTEIDRLIEQGLTLYGEGDLDGALLLWERVLVIDPENPQANSYVEYVRMNYELLTSEGNIDDSGPFGIGDGEPEYQIEILPGEDIAAVPPPLYMDARDEGWLIGEDRDSGAPRTTESVLLELDAEEPPDGGDPQTFEADKTGESVSFEDNTREYPGGAGRPTGALLDHDLHGPPGPPPISIDFEPSETPAFGSSSDFQTPQGFGSQTTDVRRRELGFVQPTEIEHRAPGPPELQIRLRTPAGTGAKPAADVHRAPTANGEQDGVEAQDGDESLETTLDRHGERIVDRSRELTLDLTPSSESSAAAYESLDLELSGTSDPKLALERRSAEDQDDGEREADDGEREAHDGEREADDGEREADDGEREADDAERDADDAERDADDAERDALDLVGRADTRRALDEPLSEEDLITTLPLPRPPKSPTKPLPGTTRGPAAEAASPAEPAERSPVVSTPEAAGALALEQPYTLQLDPLLAEHPDPHPLAALTRDLSDKPTNEMRKPSRPDDLVISAPTRELGLRDASKRAVTEDETTGQVDVHKLRSARVAGRPEVPPKMDPIDARSAEILEDIDRASPGPSAPGATGSFRATSETREERTRRRITALLERASEWARKSELERAVTAVDLALSEDPNSALAQKLIQRNRDVIMNAFQAFLGDLQRTPSLARPLHELGSAPISPRAAFLLSRVDGTLSLDEILDVSGMPRLEAYRYLCQLLLRGILR